MKYASIHGLAGVGVLEGIDQVAQPDTTSLLLKIIVTIFSLIPTIKELLSKKKADA
jgi:hypothetical protein